MRASGATNAVREWLTLSGIPAVCSLMGLDAIVSEYAWNLGLIGSYGHRYANLALANCDCLLVLGSRLDTRQTGTRPETFARGAKVIHVDIDDAELGRKVKAELAIHSPLRPFAEKLLAAWKAYPIQQQWTAWKDRLDFYRKRYPTGGGGLENESIDPNRLMKRLGDALGNKTIVCLDVGQHQMWASQSLAIRGDMRMLNAGGMGAMGFGLPAAIGAAFAASDRRIVMIAGDGGMQVNLQELQTVVRWKLPIAMIVLNNRSLGMVRQFQDLYFGGRQTSTVDGYSSPNFVKLSEAYGIPGSYVSNEEEFRAWAASVDAQRTVGPDLTEIEIAMSSAVHPKLGVGRPVEDMEPLLEREELRRLLLVPPIEEEGPAS
ncbi:thiamine pyrophosphate-binding protein [Cohnella herbarum]|uniref:thiamine pyrophosphate-binding protein n=1 Tax=Cohnella herbarum TaxID=2728023 RepID=UPI001C2C7599|nr:thiamine pyrophosphate-dependent enzyme [Cohnella herbarum]